MCTVVKEVFSFYVTGISERVLIQNFEYHIFTSYNIVVKKVYYKKRNGVYKTSIYFVCIISDINIILITLLIFCS